MIHNTKRATKHDIAGNKIGISKQEYEDKQLMSQKSRTTKRHTGNNYRLSRINASSGEFDVFSPAD